MLNLPAHNNTSIYPHRLLIALQHFLPHWTGNCGVETFFSTPTTPTIVGLKSNLWMIDYEHYCSQYDLCKRWFKGPGYEDKSNNKFQI